MFLFYDIHWSSEGFQPARLGESWVAGVCATRSSARQSISGHRLLFPMKVTEKNSVVTVQKAVSGWQSMSASVERNAERWDLNEEELA